ncbi:staphylokinase domain-containing protein [Streptococcus ictaluri]|uniref:Streptokinase C n=1 Tax=Streptococcus ictaluri 707-05 TaxID=764299 RepID=G5JZQ1_9STRE|nr:hypothetical protein [Streptococcus ictaluri]EHI70701.1 streptokinase C [Streptococcus ictaluri 707-05]
MKKRLSFGMVALLSAITLGASKPVHAIAGPGWLLDTPTSTNSKLIINVNGIVEGTNQEINIKISELDLQLNTVLGKEPGQKSKQFDSDSAYTSRKLEKADLLKVIQEKLVANARTNADYFKVIDFADDAKITDRYNKIYFADKDDSVTVPIHPNQNFLLSGHVRLKPYQAKAITESAEDVQINYEVNFISENGDDDFKPLLRDMYDLKKLAVGDSITSSELKAIAQTILSQKYPEYLITERESAVVTHDKDIFRTIFSGQDEFTYQVKDREQAYQINGKSGDKEKAQNTDVISEVYYIMKKGDKPYNYADRSNMSLVTVNYVDDENKATLRSESLYLKNEHQLDFADLYDVRDKHKLLLNNLDAFGILDYSLTGKVDDNQDEANRVVTIYMAKRPEGKNASYHVAYDKDRYSEEEREAYSYLRDLGTPAPETTFEK